MEGRKRMSHDVRSELSKKNPYHLGKHKFLELKHFCLQYPDWKKAYLELSQGRYPETIGREIRGTGTPDSTSDIAIEMHWYHDKMDLVKRVAEETDDEIGSYIFLAVTNGYPFSYLKTKLEIPCERDMYYDRYRKFFWKLAKER